MAWGSTFTSLKLGLPGTSWRFTSVHVSKREVLTGEVIKGGVLLPLERVGKAKIHKTGKSVLIEYDPRGSVFTHKLFINRAELRRVLDDKQALVNVVTPVHESRVSKKFDV